MTMLDCDIAVTLGSFDLAVSERLPLDGITAVFGASGSGKTTLLRLLAGLETRGRGRISLDGTVWQDGSRIVPAHERRLGYVFQDGALFDHLAVRGNLRFPVRFARGAPVLSFDEVVDVLDLSALLERRPATLSGGERQRVAIARALLGASRLLLMDEPVSALDTGRRRTIVDLIAGLPDRFGIPVIYVTHDAGELMRLADRAVLLDAGRVVIADDVHRVAHHAAFGGSTIVRDASSLLDAIVDSHTAQMTTLSLDGQSLRIPPLASRPTGNIRVRIPARDVVIALSPPTGLSIRNAMETTVESVIDREGALCDLVLRLKDQTFVARVTRNAVDELQLSEGQQVFALIKSVAVDDALGA